MLEGEDVKYPVVKLASVVAATSVGLSWNDIAAMVATAYTFLLILDFLWKKIGKPYARSRGWVEPTVHGDL